VDPKTGRDLWKIPRPSDAQAEAKQAYTTPYPFHGPDGVRIVLTGADYVTAHDPATGREIWRSPSYNPKNERAYRTVPSPVASDAVVLTAAPRGGDLYALALGAGAKGSARQWTWTVARDAPDVPTPLAFGGRFYVLEGNGRYLFCVEPVSGRVLWRERLDARAPFQASPTAGDGKIYCLSMKGEVFVVAAGDTFQMLHQTQFDSKDSRASIAIAGGQLFIRTDGDLFCVGPKD
jgi:outer membrane protein assembly factor BamB